MGDTAIGWTHRPGTRGRTWNPTKGCSRVSEGCRHCYAEQQAARIVRMGKGKPTPYDDLVKLVNGEARWTGKVNLVPDVLAQPMRWRQPSTIFVNSMSDLFHESLTNEQIAAVFGVMAACPHHTFQVLTKRAQRMREWFEWAAPVGKAILDRISTTGMPPHPRRLIEDAALTALNGVAETIPAWRDGNWPLHNVWVGVSCENQEAADERIPDLLEVPAAVRFLSCEPLLGPIDLSEYFDPCAVPCGEDPWPLLDWVIDGCESGPGARAAQQEWFEALCSQCQSAGVSYYHKQQFVDGKLHTDPDCFPPGLQIQQWPA